MTIFYYEFSKKIIIYYLSKRTLYINLLKYKCVIHSEISMHGYQFSFDGRTSKTAGYPAERRRQWTSEEERRKEMNGVVQGVKR